LRKKQQGGTRLSRSTIKKRKRQKASTKEEPFSKTTQTLGSLPINTKKIRETIIRRHSATILDSQAQNRLSNLSTRTKRLNSISLMRDQLHSAKAVRDRLRSHSLQLDRPITKPETQRMIEDGRQRLNDLTNESGLKRRIKKLREIQEKENTRQNVIEESRQRLHNVNEAEVRHRLLNHGTLFGLSKKEQLSPQNKTNNNEVKL